MQAEQTIQNGEIAVEGHACKRGEVYARTEMINPQRVLTTVFPVFRGGVVSCKSNGTLDKNLLFDVIKLIKKQRVHKPIKVGDVLIKNVLDTGIDIVATADKE
jgi:CxxC motif-containing protein